MLNCFRLRECSVAQHCCTQLKKSCHRFGANHKAVLTPAVFKFASFCFVWMKFWGMSKRFRVLYHLSKRPHLVNMFCHIMSPLTFFRPLNNRLTIFTVTNKPRTCTDRDKWNGNKDKKWDTQNRVSHNKSTIFYALLYVDKMGLFKYI